MKSIDDLNNNIFELKKEFQQKFQKELIIYLQENVFSKMPKLETIAWEQFTDCKEYGDAKPICYFYLDDSTLTLNNMPELEAYYKLISNKDIQDNLDSINDFFDSINDFFDSIDPLFMNFGFGPNQKITIHKNGQINIVHSQLLE